MFKVIRNDIDICMLATDNLHDEMGVVPSQVVKEDEHLVSFRVDSIHQVAMLMRSAAELACEMIVVTNNNSI